MEVNLFKRGDEADSGNHGGMTLLSTAWSMREQSVRFWKMKQNRCRRRQRKIGEGQAGFRPTRRCADNTYTLGEVIQRRRDTGLKACRFSLDVQNTKGTVWRVGCARSCGKWNRRNDVQNGEDDNV